MSIDWKRPLINGRGDVATYAGVDHTTGRHRASTHAINGYTTWLFDENGICRADGQPSEYDVRNS